MPKGIYKDPIGRAKKISDSLKGHPMYKSKSRSEKLSRSLTGKVSVFKGKTHTVEAKEKNRLAHIGRPSLSPTKFVKNDIRITGENNPNWKGGISPIKKKIRESVEYKNWRNAVLLRDNWTCQLCSKRGGELHADHIKAFAFHPELRHEISNGRTLCFDCHKKQPNSSSRKHLCCL